MRANSWLYHFYLVQTKLQYGMNYEGQQPQQQQQQASTSRSSASASSPGGGYGYPHMINNSSPVPSSSCSASGDTSTTPQPAHFQQQQQHLVPPPLTSPLYAPPPTHHHHPHNHLFPSPVMDTYQHFQLHPQQQQHQHQQHQIHPSAQSGNGGSSNSGANPSNNPHFAFTPSPGSGHHSYSGLGGPFSLGQQESSSPYHSHQQLHQHIKTETYHSDLVDRPELGGYHVSFSFSYRILLIDKCYGD